MSPLHAQYTQEEKVIHDMASAKFQIGLSLQMVWEPMKTTNNGYEMHATWSSSSFLNLYIRK